MGKIIGYGKLGRSMPLTLEKCGNLGGDVEMVAVVKELALRHRDDLFVLVGRNSGDPPDAAGFPSNVVNPWSPTNVSYDWKSRLDRAVRDAELKGVTLTSERQLRLAEIFDDITFSTFEKLDAMIMWVGQHGTSNTPIPMVDDPTRLTKPQDWCAWYAGFLLRGINHWRDIDPWNREEINLNADARNRHKMRDLKWPLRHPVLAQFKSEKLLKHHRYGDTDSPDQSWIAYAQAIGDETWLSTIHDTYARLEVNGLRPGTPFGDLISYDETWDRHDFGLFINEARSIGIRPALQRKTILRDWVLPLDPYFIHGTWSKESLAELGLPCASIHPTSWANYYPRLHAVRCTFTTPSSGSGWATAKPWEAFAAGTVCFFHPMYDTQNNILADAPSGLADWLRVRSMSELFFRVKHLGTVAGMKDWEWAVRAQRAHFDAAMTELRYVKMIEDRIYGGTT